MPRAFFLSQFSLRLTLGGRCATMAAQFGVGPARPQQPGTRGVMRKMLLSMSPMRVKPLILRLLVAALLALLALSPAGAYETDVFARDPSTVVKSGGTYWVYGTGRGVSQFSSTDRVHWTFRGPVFPTAPAWVASTVPANRGNNAWAPDVRFFSGLWHLYYAYSSFGSKVSGIGLATNPTLDPKTWADQGVVIRTGRDTSYNAIDPCIFQDAGGKPWLSFGSYFSGIKLIALDPATGKQAAGDVTVYNIADRPDTPPNAIEASCVYYHGGYFYLFVAWDRCCAGPRSTYNIRMGRSQTVTGPYLDKTGKDMEAGGGTLFLGSVGDNGSGRPPDDEVGPGHAGILEDTDGPYVSYHEEWARDKGGKTTLNINKLTWDSDGWPRLVLDPGPYRLVSALATHTVAEAAGGGTGTGTAVQTSFPTGGLGQQWTLHFQGQGYYSLVNAASGKALGVAGDAATPGAHVEIAPPTGRDGQKWYVQQNDDGTWTLLSKSSGKALALDVSGCSLLDDAPLEQWTANGADCQKWSFRER